MDRHNVHSSTLQSVGYDPETQTLELAFLSGGIYRYSGVPQAVYSGILRAASKGSYFHQEIKDRYPFVRVR